MGLGLGEPPKALAGGAGVEKGQGVPGVLVQEKPGDPCGLLEHQCHEGGQTRGDPGAGSPAMHLLLLPSPLKNPHGPPQGPPPLRIPPTQPTGPGDGRPHGPSLHTCHYRTPSHAQALPLHLAQFWGQLGLQVPQFKSYSATSQIWSPGKLCHRSPWGEAEVQGSQVRDQCHTARMEPIFEPGRPGTHHRQPSWYLWGSDPLGTV